MLRPSLGCKMLVRVSTCRGETGEEEGTEEVEWGRNGTSILPGVPTQSSDAGVPRRGCPQAEALLRLTPKERVLGPSLTTCPRRLSWKGI